eukprot:scaffold107481_cov14-Tisochrysis_lutea.AAC.1
MTTYNGLLHGVSRAVCRLANQLWVPGRAGLHGRPLLSCLPQNSATQLFNALSMQVGGELTKEH